MRRRPRRATANRRDFGHSSAHYVILNQQKVPLPDSNGPLTRNRKGYPGTRPDQATGFRPRAANDMPDTVSPRSLRNE